MKEKQDVKEELDGALYSRMHQTPIPPEISYASEPFGTLGKFKMVVDLRGLGSTHPQSWGKGMRKLFGRDEFEGHVGIGADDGHRANLRQAVSFHYCISHAERPERKRCPVCRAVPRCWCRSSNAQPNAFTGSPRRRQNERRGNHRGKRDGYVADNRMCHSP